jgi:hydrogenase/urease accessory protein HupE
MRFLSAFLATLFLASAAHAHGGDSSASGWTHDVLHFLGGADHTVALISVGILFLLIALAPFAGRKLARSFGAAKALFEKRRSTRG